MDTAPSTPRPAAWR